MRVTLRRTAVTIENGIHGLMKENFINFSSYVYLWDKTPRI